MILSKFNCTWMTKLKKELVMFNTFIVSLVFYLITPFLHSAVLQLFPCLFCLLVMTVRIIIFFPQMPSSDYIFTRNYEKKGKCKSWMKQVRVEGNLSFNEMDQNNETSSMCFPQQWQEQCTHPCKISDSKIKTVRFSVTNERSQKLRHKCVRTCKELWIQMKPLW